MKPLSSNGERDAEVTIKTSMDVEALLRWAYQDELSKRQLSSAEGIWDRIMEDGRRGGIDPGHGAAQRYAHFGLPDPDAERIEKAISVLEDIVIDWHQSFHTIAAELSALISINEVTQDRSRLPRQTKAGWGAAGTKAAEAWWGKDAGKPIHEKPRDVLMVGGISISALLTMHAVKGTRPDWVEDLPKPRMIPAPKGPNAVIVGECRGKNLYTAGSYCPLRYSPSPVSIIMSRADYVAWHHGLIKLAQTLELQKFIVLPPKASPTPWLDNAEEYSSIIPVMPTRSNRVSDWGTLPLVPSRGRKGPPLRVQKAGPVRHVLTNGGKSLTS